MRIPFAIPARADRGFDVVGVGENSVDYVAVAPEHPAPNAKQQLEGFAIHAGGQIATALVTCARLGWRTRYIGSFGDDEPGRYSRESLAREGVDVTAARVARGATNRVAVVLVDRRAGARTILWYRGVAPSAGDMVPAAAISGRLLLVDCDDIGTATAAATAARRSGVPTVVDIDSVQPGIDDLLRQIDAIIAAEELPGALTGHADLGRALEAIEHEYRAAVVCVTLGPRGSLARCGGREIRTPGFAVDSVDTTGAGDVFRGAFASGCLRWPAGDLEDVLAYANAAAALSCRAVGARGGLPGEQEIDRLLKV